MIFLDIDGTVLSPEGIHPRTVAGIRRAQEAGHLVFINTGRSIGIIPPEVLEAVRPDGIVAGLGSWIRVGEQLLLSEVVPKDLLLFAMRLSEKYQNPIILEGENDCAGYGEVGWWGAERTLKTPEELFQRFPDPRVSKLTFSKRLTDPEIRELQPYFSVFNHPNYAEVGIPERSKATGMVFLRERFGIDRDHTIAMGDSDNDAEMLRAAGIAVVMGNAPDEVKRLAHLVAPDCRDGGVGIAIEQLLFGAEPV